MELILIACSKTKRMGGYIQFVPSSLVNILSDEKYLQLMNSRKELASIINITPGLDLGFSNQDQQLAFLPAYQRYNGKFYQKNNFSSVYPELSTKRVIIISALYGVLDANDHIRNYELTMDHTLSIGVRVKTWWKNHGLGKIIGEIVCQRRFIQVHDLLPISYRDAIKPWPTNCRNESLIQYDYPGQGSGSIWRRAEELKRILGH